jgi:cytochrome c peroxidase
VDLPLGLQIDALYQPDDNPPSTEKFSLGRQLFFDRRLSVDQTIACATCHDPDRGFADGRPLAVGVTNVPGRRNTPTIVNRAFSKEQFLDGRGADLEAQARGPLLSPDEMGFSEDGIVMRLKGRTGYREQFKKVFGTGKSTFNRWSTPLLRSREPYFQP